LQCKVRLIVQMLPAQPKEQGKDLPIVVDKEAQVL
jgi:hypothetical protein